MSRRAVAALTAVAALAAVGWWGARSSAVIEVTAGLPVGLAVRAAPEGALIRLLPGRHEPFEVDREVTVEAAAGAVVGGPVEISSHGARLIGVRVVGGETGIRIRHADNVVLERVAVRGAHLNGIEVVAGSAAIRDCRVGDLVSEYGRGINIRNTNGHPRTVVEGCRVDSGQEALVSHVGRVEFRNNRITGTTLRAVSVNEMSEGLIEDNTVRGVSGIGVYCGDMSHCEVRGNTVRGVTPDERGGRSRQGYGLVVWYHSKARAVDNRFEVPAPEPVGVFLDSATTKSFPLSYWPPGWKGALPALGVAALALGALFLVRLALGPLVRRRRERARPTAALGNVALAVLTGGFVIQTFHMLEHGVQVVQVYVAQAEVRSGLLGARVDTEWVHFAYNLAVMIFLAWAWSLARPGRPLGARLARSLPWLGAAVLVQGYHLAEHVAKIVQHVSLGIDPAPGILGGPAGLVWFHFGINLAVYVGMAIPLAGVVLALRPSTRRVPAAAY